VYRSRPATPTTTVFLCHSPCSRAQRPPTTRPPQNLVLRAALRRRVACASVADDALSAACAERSKASYEALCHWHPLGLRRLTCFGKQRTRARTSLAPRPISQLYLRHPPDPERRRPDPARTKPLAARRPKVCRRATSYSLHVCPLAIASSLLKTSVFLEVCRCVCIPTDVST
jgi:hypothetical protein